MATIVLTTTATALARELVESIPGVGILFIHWLGPLKNVVRGTSGQPEWQTIAQPEWEAYVGSYTRFNRAEIEFHTINIEGILVLIDAKAGAVAGSLVVNAIEGKFQVVHHAP